MNSTSRISRPFTNFPRLPAELRLQIWRLALSSGRSIEIRRTITTITGNGVIKNSCTWKPLSSLRAPTLFFVCQESRAEVLKVYILLRGTDPGAEAVYYNHDRDILCFRYNGFHTNIKKSLAELSSISGKKVRNIAIGRSLMWYGDGFISGEAIYKFRHLKEVVIADDGLVAFQTPMKRLGLAPSDRVSPDTAHYRTVVEDECKEIERLDRRWQAPRVTTGTFVLGGDDETVTDWYGLPVLSYWS